MSEIALLSAVAAYRGDPTTENQIEVVYQALRYARSKDDELYLDEFDCALIADGVPYRFTPREFRALTVLFEQFGQMVDYQTLCNRVWGPRSRWVDVSNYMGVITFEIRRKLPPGLILERHFRSGFRLLRCGSEADDE